MKPYLKYGALAVALMILTALVLWFMFKRRGWLSWDRPSAEPINP